MVVLGGMSRWRDGWDRTSGWWPEDAGATLDSPAWAQDADATVQDATVAAAEEEVGDIIVTGFRARSSIR